MAVQNSTVERPALHAPAMTPAAAGAHRAASHVRIVLPMPERLVANYDDLGSYWGVDSVTKTLAMIDDARRSGEQIDEWTVTDRAGHRLRIVRIADPDFIDTISVIPLGAPQIVGG